MGRLSVLVTGAAAVAATVAFLPGEADRRAADPDRLGSARPAAGVGASTPAPDGQSPSVMSSPSRGEDWSPEVVAEPECDRAAGRAIAGPGAEPVIHDDADPDADPAAAPTPIDVPCADPATADPAAARPSPTAAEPAPNG